MYVLAVCLWYSLHIVNMYVMLCVSHVNSFCITKCITSIFHVLLVVINKMPISKNLVHWIQFFNLILYFKTKAVSTSMYDYFHSLVAPKSGLYRVAAVQQRLMYIEIHRLFIRHGGSKQRDTYYSKKTSQQFHGENHFPATRLLFKASRQTSSVQECYIHLHTNYYDQWNNWKLCGQLLAGCTLSIHNKVIA